MKFPADNIYHICMCVPMVKPQLSGNKLLADNWPNEAVTLSDQQVWVKSESNTYWQGGVINALDRPQWAGSPLRCSQILSSYNSNFHPSFPHNDKKKKDFICTCEWLMLWLQGYTESHILGNTRRDFEEWPINYSWPKIIKQKYIKRTWRYKIKHCGWSLNHID